MEGGQLAGLIEALRDDAREALIRDLCQAHRTYADDEGIVFPLKPISPLHIGSSNTVGSSRRASENSVKRKFSLGMRNVATSEG